MLLRSPSATTTGHPLRVHAGERVETATFSSSSFTYVNVLTLKDFENSMKAKSKTPIRYNTVGTRLLPEEAATIADAANASGLTVSEWVRQALLEGTQCPPWARLMLGEFLALRSVVVDLQRDLMQGVKPSTDRMKAILDVADARKFAVADGRLATLRTTKETPAK